MTTTSQRPTLLDLPVDDPEWLAAHDVDGCMDLLDARGAWLHDVKHITDQWPRSMRGAAGGPGGRTFDRAGQLRDAANRGHLWGIRDVTNRIVACCILDEHPDPDYLEHYPTTAFHHSGTPFREPRCFYVHRMATALDCAGHGLGSRLLAHAAAWAQANAAVYLRLECSRTNLGLHRYYAGQGFRQVNDVEVAGRFSGALFQRVINPTRLSSGTW